MGTLVLSCGGQEDGVSGETISIGGMRSRPLCADFYETQEGLVLVEKCQMKTAPTTFMGASLSESV